MDLVMSERQGIEIDYCPKCRGVWLDRGELDKIIERSNESVAMPQATQPQVPPQVPGLNQQYPQQPIYRQYPQPEYDSGYYIDKQRQKKTTKKVF